jgi:NADH-quinone oxidoreductase subunit K
VTPVGLSHYLVVGALLFVLGLFTVVTRKNAVGILLGVELILNAGALNFVAFDHFAAEPVMSGQVFAVFVIALAAAEAAIALAIVLQVYRAHRSIDADALTELRH